MKKQLQTLFGAAIVAAFAMPVTAEAVMLIPGADLTIETDEMTEYTYVATQNGLLTINGFMLSSYSGEVKAKDADGNEKNISFWGNYTPEQTAFYVEKGYTYSFENRISSYYLPATISCTFTPQEIVSGPTCEDAMPLLLDQNLLIPTYGVMDYSTWDYDYDPVYVTFTAPFDGKLDLTVDVGFGSFSYADSCDGSWVSSSYVYKTTDGMPFSYYYGFPMKEGETLIFKCERDGAVMAYARFREVVLGSTCDDAFEAVEGENVIPAEAGTYWYKWRTPAEAPDGNTSNIIVTILTDANVTGSLTGSCTANYWTPYTPMDIRSQEYTDFLKVLKVEKATATAADEKFTISYSSPEPIDDRTIGEPIEIGEKVVLPKWNGTYYYSFETGDEPMMLTLTSEIPESWGYSGNFNCTMPSGYPSVGSGKTFRGPVQPNTKYIVTANDIPASNGDASFTVTLEPLEQGAAEIFPLIATIGDNKMIAFPGGDLYYTFTPTEDAYYFLKSSVDGVRLSMQVYLDPTSDYASSVNNVAEVDGGWKLECTAGLVYKLNFSNVEEEGTLTIENRGYAEGESAATALPLTEKIEIPFGPVKLWYKLTAAQDGFLVLESTLDPKYGNNQIMAYVGEVTDSNKQSMTYSSNPDWTYSFQPLKVAVNKDQEVYVCVINQYNDVNGELTYTYEEIKPGQAATKPIVIEYEEGGMYYALEKGAAYNNPVWYEITLPEGILTIDSNENFNISIYYPDNLNNELAYSQYKSQGEGSELKNFAVPANNTTYILKLTSSSSSAETLVNIVVNAPEEGQTPSKAILIEPDQDNYVYSLPDTDYGDKTWYTIYLAKGDLNVTCEDYILMSFYDGDNVITPVATSESIDNGYGLLNLDIPAEGFYYLVMTRTYGSDITLYGTAISGTVSVDQVVATNGVKVLNGAIVNGGATDVKVYDLNGVCVANVAAGATAKVAAGLYIVKDGENTLKALVK